MRLRRITRAIPAELETIVLKALEKNPQDRYATAKELADDLQRWCEDRPIQARRPSWRQVATKWAAAPGVVRAAAAAMVLTVLALGAGAAVIWQAEQEKDQALRETKQALADRTDAMQTKDAALRREQEVASRLRIHLADSRWGAGQVGWAEDLLDECRRVPPVEDWHYLAVAPSPNALFEACRAEAGLAFSADSQHLAILGGDRHVSVWNVADRTQAHRFEFRAWPGINPAGVVRGLTSVPVFSPDGQRVAGFSADDSLIVYDVTTGREQCTLSVRGQGWIDYAALWPDGQRVTMVTKKDVVRVWNAATAEQVSTFQCVGFTVGSDQLQDDLSCTTTSKDSGLLSWAMRTGRKVAFLPGLTRPVVFSPDGKFCACLRMGRPFTAAVTYDLIRGAVVGSTVPGQPLAFKPGRQAAGLWRQRGIQIRDVKSRLTLVNLPNVKAPVAYSPDGKRLACHDPWEGVSVWDVTQGERSPSSVQSLPSWPW